MKNFLAPLILADTSKKLLVLKPRQLYNFWESFASMCIIEATIERISKNIDSDLNKKNTASNNFQSIIWIFLFVSGSKFYEANFFFDCGFLHCIGMVTI